MLNPCSLVLDDTEDGRFSLLSAYLYCGVPLSFYLASDSASLEARDLPVSSTTCFENMDVGMKALSSSCCSMLIFGMFTSICVLGLLSVRPSLTAYSGVGISLSPGVNISLPKMPAPDAYSSPKTTLLIPDSKFYLYLDRLSIASPKSFFTGLYGGLISPLSPLPPLT